MYQLESSLIFGNDTDASILVHVPLIRDTQGLRLLSFHKLPIKSKTGRYDVLIAPENDFLAIDYNNNLYSEFSAAQLAQCSQINKHYICSSLQVLSNRHTRPSCLTTLFFSETDKIKTYCPLKIQKSATYVSNLNGNSFLVFNNEPQAAQKNCIVNGKTVISNFQVDTVQRLTVDENCFVQLKQHTLYSISQLSTDIVVENFKWKISFDNIIPNLSTETIDHIITSFDNQTLLEPMNPHLYQSLHNDLLAADRAHLVQEWHLPTTMSIAGGAFLVAVIIAGVVCCAGLYKRKQAAAAAAAAAAAQAHQQNIRMNYLDRMMQQPLLEAIPPSAPNL